MSENNNSSNNRRNNNSVARIADIQALLASDIINLTPEQLEIFNQMVPEISFVADGSRSVSPMSVNTEASQLETITEENPSDNVSLGNISGLTGLTAGMGGMSLQGMPNQDSSIATPTSIVDYKPESQQTEINPEILMKLTTKMKLTSNQHIIKIHQE